MQRYDDLELLYEMNVLLTAAPLQVITGLERTENKSKTAPKLTVNRWYKSKKERKENAAVNLSFSFRTPSISCLSAAKAKWNNY